MVHDLAPRPASLGCCNAELRSRGGSRSRRAEMIEVYRLSIVLFFTASVVVAQPHLGAGCTTAYFIDADCDGYGVGKKSSGIYPLGLNGNVLGSPLIATAGDLPDADDQDATVHTTAQWQAKWGSNSAGMANFLATRKGFTNTSRIYYL